MRISSSRSQSGQVLVMMTFALVLLCGMLGLVVDLGWAYFIRKSAQLAVDAGALAAVKTARVGVPSDEMHCGVSGVDCAATPRDCSAIGSGNSTFTVPFPVCQAQPFGSSRPNFRLDFRHDFAYFCLMAVAPFHHSLGQV